MKSICVFLNCSAARWMGCSMCAVTRRRSRFAAPVPVTWPATTAATSYLCHIIFTYSLDITLVLLTHIILHTLLLILYLIDSRVASPS